jgi:hypothetical protein
VEVRKVDCLHSEIQTITVNGKALLELLKCFHSILYVHGLHFLRSGLVLTSACLLVALCSLEEVAENSPNRISVGEVGPYVGEGILVIQSEDFVRPREKSLNG